MSHNTSHGWIKLHRCLLEHPLWLNSTSQQKVVLVTLLMLANHAEKQWEWQQKPYTCKPGQLITSLESLRKKCDLSLTIQNIRSALKRFESMGFINKQSNTHNTLITICNWERYQNDTEDDNIPDNISPTDGQQTTSKRVTTNKNDKECKNDKELICIPQTTNRQEKETFHKPTAQEVQAYAQSIDYWFDSQNFCDYYESKGWMIGKSRMKDWQAAVRTWKHNENKYHKDKKYKLPKIGEEVLNDGQYKTITA